MYNTPVGKYKLKKDAWGYKEASSASGKKRKYKKNQVVTVFAAVKNLDNGNIYVVVDGNAFIYLGYVTPAHKSIRKKVQVKSDMQSYKLPSTGDVSGKTTIYKKGKKFTAYGEWKDESGRVWLRTVTGKWFPQTSVRFI